MAVAGNPIVRCYLCGNQANTRDHVPARCFFKTVPQNIIVLPACRDCNGSISRDEEYMRTQFAAHAFGRSDSATTLWTGRIHRALHGAFQGLRRLLLRNIVTVDVQDAQGNVLGQVPAMVVDGGRACRVIRKIVKGLYYSQRQQRLDDGDFLIFRCDETQVDFERLTRKWAEFDMGEGFRFRCIHHNEGSGIWLQFYRCIDWFVITGEAARNYRNR